MALTFKKYLVKHETSIAGDIADKKPAAGDTVSTKSGDFLIVQRIDDDAYIITHIIDSHYHENYLSVKGVGMIETHKPKFEKMAKRWHAELERFKEYEKYVG